MNLMTSLIVDMSRAAPALQFLTWNNEATAGDIRHHDDIIYAFQNVIPPFSDACSFPLRSHRDINNNREEKYE